MGAGRARRAAAAGRRWAPFGAAAAVLLAVGILALATGGSGSDASAGSTSTGGTATGTVERRTLAERLTATGTIGYAGEDTVLARRAGTVTALPEVGDVIRRGEPLYAIDGEPVLLLYGAVPAYRTLAEGVAHGKDVEQLERNLASLGYDPGTVDGEFTYATAAAVRAWQEARGVEATGKLALGTVAFLPGPQRVTRLEATLGGALGGEPPSAPVLLTSSTRRVVAVELEAGRQSIAHRGQKVGVVLPGGAEVPGRVRRLAAVESSGEGAPGEESGGGVEATIALTGGHRIPALDGASVSVRFTERVRRDVLSVPLTALVAVGGERFAVYAREGAGRRQVLVTPGLAADGYVEVEGRGLRAGMKVETGE